MLDAGFALMLLSCTSLTGLTIYVSWHSLKADDQHHLLYAHSHRTHMRIARIWLAVTLLMTLGATVVIVGGISRL